MDIEQTYQLIDTYIQEASFKLLSSSYIPVVGLCRFHHRGCLPDLVRHPDDLGGCKGKSVIISHRNNGKCIAPPVIFVYR